MAMHAGTEEDQAGMTSSRDETSRVLAPWLRQPSASSPKPGLPAPLVLFLCRSNEAVSIMAECILRHLAQERLRVGSAGDSAASQVRPYAIECLRAHGIATEGLRCKAWGEFFGRNRPSIRFLIAFCDVYATKTIWHEDTLIACWNMLDRATVVGSDIDIQVAFEEAFTTLQTRIQRFLALPLEELNAPALAQEVQRVGEAW